MDGTDGISWPELRASCLGWVADLLLPILFVASSFDVGCQLGSWPALLNLKAIELAVYYYEATSRSPIKQMQEFITLINMYQGRRITTFTGPVSSCP
jgi:hypothetical protein